MGTIGITLIFKNEESYKKVINNISHHDSSSGVPKKRILNGLWYCTVLREGSKNLNLELKLSYSKFFDISSDFSEELGVNDDSFLEVHKDFIKAIRSYGVNEKDINIKLTRVDISFDYPMMPGKLFTLYKNVFYYMAYSLKKRCEVARTVYTAYATSDEVETYIFSNHSNVNKSDLTIKIYNQSYKFLDCCSNDPLVKYSFLRIGVSKRIKRKSFTLNEYENFDIFYEYRMDFRDTILEYCFDFKAFMECTKLETDRLKEQLKKFDGNYKDFILRNHKDIRSYQSVREAVTCELGEDQFNKNKKEIDRYINMLEMSSKIFIHGVSDKLKEMREFFLSLEIG